MTAQYHKWFVPAGSVVIGAQDPPLSSQRQFVRDICEKRSGKATPEKRPGVTINRRDLIAVPVPDANLPWRDLHVRDTQKVDGRQTTLDIRIDITVEGVTDSEAWTCGLEFDHANEESLHCRPLRRLSAREADWRRHRRVRAPGR